MAQKRPFKEQRNGWKKNKKQKKSTTNDGSNEDVLLADVRTLLQETKITNDESMLPEQQSEIELNITELSSTGDGLAARDGRVYVVPFTAPGDTVQAKVYKHMQEEAYSLTDFLQVIKPSQHRTETPRCPYFAKCSGCQFQHLPYSYQLAHKRRVIEKAYANFSGLPPSSFPEVGETIGSPLQYGYRTKLTPHFDGPPMGRKDKRAGKKVTWPEVPPIGFMKKGTRKTIDIEDCPIGTEAVRLGMASERKRVAQNIDKYQRGATLLLRESTQRINKTETKENGTDSSESGLGGVVMEDRGDHIHRKTCITDHKATSTEYIDDFRFDSPAGAFFQNNNTILPLVTQYIRDNIFAPTHSQASYNDKPRIKNLVDAYSGSGFFTITLSALFTNSIGIDISPDSIASATRNAELNNLPASSTKFIAADASSLFASLDTQIFKPEETVVVLDPPRKGCDQSFIRQLAEFGPERVCYVSCNVHTQARDVGWLVGGFGKDGEAGGGLYEIESLRGFDFFPQTGHVEGVAILRKKTGVEKETQGQGRDESVAED
jgi:tRNA (uracil-5-)-methyltransferase